LRECHRDGKCPDQEESATSKRWFHQISAYRPYVGQKLTCIRPIRASLISAGPTVMLPPYRTRSRAPACDRSPVPAPPAAFQVGWRTARPQLRWVTEELRLFQSRQVLQSGGMPKRWDVNLKPGDPAPEIQAPETKSDLFRLS